MAAAAEPQVKALPFDAAHLDALMEAAGLDVLVVTSKQNVQYLLGGYRCFFFDTMEAIGTTRYLPALVYQKGRPENAAYIGCAIENFEKELGRFWPPALDLGGTGTVSTMRRVVAHINKLGPSARRIGIEAPFMPADADAVLRAGVERAVIGDAVFPLERLRCCKTPEEIGYLREASERVVDAMQATFKRHCRPGASKLEVAEHLRREEVERGLVFDYLLITSGTSLNRAPSPRKLAAGDIISLDSGGNYKGYIGDLCRMGIIGKPDQELVDCLGAVEEIQQAVRAAVRPGGRGGDICDTAERILAGSPHKRYTHFQAHGMGLVTHEAPRLMNNPRNSYDGYDMERPLEPGMCVSIETTMGHPKRGFIKLEDTVLVTAGGHQALGDGARGWNRAGG